MTDYEIEFEFDASKEAQNIKKHGYSFQDAMECFHDENAITFKDIRAC